MKNEKWNQELSEYIKQGELDQASKAENWEVAIGLQDVDGLKPSQYLIDTAKEHIEGIISLEEVKYRINSYYEKTNEERDINETEEADKVASRINEIISENSFTFSITELLNIHKRLFDGILEDAGQFRTYNFTKKEWVLDNDTVVYASQETIKDTIVYDLEQERNFSYKDLGIEEAIKHLSKFISNLWQIHPFSEGNTRTTAVFLIKYLKSFGFNINNESFINNSWYFRNALVRANYNNFEKQVFEDISFLEKFFYNLLTDSNYELKNRYLHIDYRDGHENINSNNSISIEEQAILNIIKDNPTIKQEEIAGLINKSLRTVKNYMIGMQDKGLISRKNGKRVGEWIVEQ